MGRPDTLGGLIRKERLLAVSLGASAALAALGGVFELRWLVVFGAVVALAGAGVRIWLAVRQNRLDEDRDKITSGRGLRVPVARIAEINPNDIGIDRAEQEILQGGGLPEYVPRHIDNQLRKSLRAAFEGTGEWIVVVSGPSKVGKSRTLFEALKVCAGPDVVVVAPANGASLLQLLTPGDPLYNTVGSVLWLDDLEPLLNEGVTYQTLKEWRDGDQGRVVCATYGGKGSDLIAESAGPQLATLAQQVLRNATEIGLEETTSSEVAAVLGHLSNEQANDIALHGLAAYLVAAPLLDRKLTTRRHAPGEPECPHGQAVVYAAVDWARTGRTAPLPADTLRRLWAAFLSPGSPSGDDAFAEALEWAIKPVVGSIALAREESGGLVAFDYVVHLVNSRPDPRNPRSEVWAEAAATASDEEALAVGIAAHLSGLLDQAEIAFRGAVHSGVHEVAAAAGFNLGVTLGALERPEEEIAVYDSVVDRYGNDSDPELRELTALALFNKAVRLGELERPEEEIAVYDEVVARYGNDSDPDLRTQTAEALYNKGVALGELDRPEAAIAVYDSVVDRYDSDPDLHIQTARALYNKGVRLGELDRPEAAIAVYDSVVDRYGNDSDPELRELTALALFNKAVRLGELERPEEEIAVYDEVVDRYGSDPAPDLRTKAAEALTNKGLRFGVLNRSEEAIAVYDSVVDRYGDDPAPDLRTPTAVALINKGVQLGALDRPEDAIAVYDEVVDRYGNDSDPDLRSRTAQALNNKGNAQAKTGDAHGAIAAWTAAVAAAPPFSEGGVLASLALAAVRAFQGDDESSTGLLMSVAEQYESASTCLALLSADSSAENLTGSSWEVETDSDLLNFVGIALRRLGRRDTAISVWTRSSELDDAVAPLLLALAK